MQFAQILSPEENLSYVIEKFKELLPETCEELKNNANDLKNFNSNMDKILEAKGSKKNPQPDPHAFIEFITKKDL